MNYTVRTNSQAEAIIIAAALEATQRRKDAGAITRKEPQNAVRQMLLIQERAAWDSPASNGGRGLKLASPDPPIINGADSPASNGGRGLKQCNVDRNWHWPKIRPPAMAGVD